MAPEDRRAAIVAATMPLLRERGWTLTTTEIATAAGVSEGTLFSVFKDKDELLITTLQAALDPQPTVERLSQIDPALPLEDRLVMAVEILQNLTTQVWQMTGALLHEEVKGRLPRRFMGDFFARDLLSALFEPSISELRIDPAVAGHALMVLATAGSNPVLFRTPLNASEIVTILLEGIRIPKPSSSVDGRTRRKRPPPPA